MLKDDPPRAAETMVQGADLSPPFPILCSPDNEPPPRGQPKRAIGQTLGRCLLIESLGRGSSCTVYRALHRLLNLPVAVKVLDNDALPARAFAQLQREARLLARLRHPHIVRIFDFNDAAARPYMVLELVEGPSLKELIRQSGRLQADRAVAIGLQVVSGLAAIWELGAVHRDIKPANILLARDGTAKIIDLGEVVFFTGESDRAAFPAGVSPEEFAGTLAYLAPEQLQTPPEVDPRSDIYSLGVTLYEAITGRLPFEGRSPMKMVCQHAQDLPEPPHHLVAGLPVALSEVILTMLAKDPDDRFQSAEELQEALRQSLSPVPLIEETAASSPCSQPRPPFWFSMASVFLPRRTPPRQVWADAMKRTLLGRGKPAESLL